MRNLCVFALALSALAASAPGSDATEIGKPGTKFNPQVAAYLRQRVGEFDQIPAERKQALETLAAYVRNRSSAGEPARLVFICTHNSRRSHLSQIWAAAAANYYGVPKVECSSGGTEATAFNPRAIAALERAGVEIQKSGDDKNPKYQVRVAEGIALECFSKKYGDAPNPAVDFCAVMTCSNADKNCPTVDGSTLRVAIPYEDPKASDGTPQEASTYDERCAQICREMLYLFSQVKA